MPSMTALPVKALRRLALVLTAVLASAALAQLPEPAPGDGVRKIQAQYQAERTEADKTGLAKKFAPDWFAWADEFAKKGDAALAVNRFLEASEDFQKARWLLPALPLGLPDQ